MGDSGINVDHLRFVNDIVFISNRLDEANEMRPYELD